MAPWRHPEPVLLLLLNLADCPWWHLEQVLLLLNRALLHQAFALAAAVVVSVEHAAAAAVVVAPLYRLPGLLLLDWPAAVFPAVVRPACLAQLLHPEPVLLLLVVYLAGCPWRPLGRVQLLLLHCAWLQQASASPAAVVLPVMPAAAAALVLAPVHRLPQPLLLGKPATL
jgi:hypothetical protein